jgi:hypothetical protein
VYCIQFVDDVQPFAVGVVNSDEPLPLLWQRVLREDRLHWTLRFASAAVDALLWVDDDDALRFVDAVDWAHVDARPAFQSIHGSAMM